jgi:tetratricopeptide (TPR) repeat protein
VSDAAEPPAKRIEDVTGGYVLEQSVPLSRSRLWAMQRAFYVHQGIKAWGSGSVPHQITCNPVIASAYAEVIVAFLRDCDAAGRLDHATRVHVLELGSGSGRFAYLLLRHLRRLLGASPSLRDVPVTVVVSDFDAAKLEQLAAHPRLQADLEDGWLDIATVDAAAPGEVRTWRSGTVLRDGPLVVIANYVFDSLPAEAYAIQAGTAHLARLSVYADEPDVDLDDPGSLERLRFAWDADPEPAGPTGDDELDSLLARYADVLDTTWILLPTAALRCLDRLVSDAAAPVLALVADKGWAQRRELYGLGGPSIVPHSGCFSLMVDFDAIAHVVRGRGGIAMVPPHRPQHLVVSAFVLGGIEATETAASYADRLAEGGPDDVYDVRAALAPVGGQLTLEQALSILRMARWDSQLFLDLFPVLLQLAPVTTGPVKADFARALRRVWEGWFPIGEPGDVALCVGILLSGIGQHRESLELFNASHELMGTNANAHMASAIAHYSLRELDQALKDVREALAMEPGLDAPRALAAEIETDLGRDDGGAFPR